MVRNKKERGTPPRKPIQEETGGKDGKKAEKKEDEIPAGLSKAQREALARECVLDELLEKGYCYIIKHGAKLVCPPWFRLGIQLKFVLPEEAAQDDNLTEEKLQKIFESRIKSTHGLTLSSFKKDLVWDDDTYEAFFEKIKLACEQLLYAAGPGNPREIDSIVRELAGYIRRNLENGLTKEDIKKQLREGGELAGKMLEAQSAVDNLAPGETINHLREADAYLSDKDFYEDLYPDPE